MIVRKIKSNFGIFFAIWPRYVSGVGLVALEWLHWERVLDTSNEIYRYRRFISQDRYDAGERANYTMPPGRYCTRRTGEPTPCHYPACKRRDAQGVDRCSEDGIAFGEN